MANTCNPDGLPYITNQCELPCYYEPTPFIENSFYINKSLCFDGIQKRQIILADYTSEDYYPNMKRFAMAIGSINILAVLYFLFRFNRKTYAEMDRINWRVSDKDTRLKTLKELSLEVLRSLLLETLIFREKLTWNLEIL